MKTKQDHLEWMRIRRAFLHIQVELRCLYCSEPLKDQNAKHRGELVTIDHLKPLSRGGSNSFDNLVVCCNGCNRRKGNMTFRQWMQTGGEQYLQRKWKTIRKIVQQLP